MVCGNVEASPAKHLPDCPSKIKKKVSEEVRAPEIWTFFFIFCFIYLFILTIACQVTPSLDGRGPVRDNSSSLVFKRRRVFAERRDALAKTQTSGASPWADFVLNRLRRDRT